MARSENSIFSQITTVYVAAMAAIGITVNPATWSRRNKQQVAMRSFAASTSAFEQISDAYVSDIEAGIAAASPQTNPWIQDKVLNLFQYDAANPQIALLDTVNGTFAPYYETPDASQRIITQCVIVPGSSGTTTVKVAKESPAVALAAGELSALQSFLLSAVDVPGISLNAVSGDADKVFIGGIVTYNGQYSGVIPIADGAVVVAIKAYLASIPKSGIVGVGSTVGLMKLTDLIAAVRAVPGVIDFELTNVNARPDATAFVPGTYNLVAGNTWLTDKWNSGLSGAGYMLGEDSVGYTLNDSLTYTPQ